MRQPSGLSGANEELVINSSGVASSRQASGSNSPSNQTFQEFPEWRKVVADDRNLRGPQDRDRVNLSQEHEVAYWTRKWGITREQLTDAVRKAGSMVSAVARKLKKSP